jgi:SynChlorMet cassette protein ScmC
MPTTARHTMLTPSPSTASSAAGAAPPMQLAPAFSLRLANGDCWSLHASQEASAFLEDFASLLHLSGGQVDPSSPWLHICSTMQPQPVWTAHTGDFDFLESLARIGWNPRNLGAVRFWTHAQLQGVICEIRGLQADGLDILRMAHALWPVQQRVLTGGGLPLHAALAEWQGRGILLAGHSGSGKSTTSRRLPKPWRALCDDECLIVPGQTGAPHAHPLPTWSENLQRRSRKTWDVQHHVPLAAIFLLAPCNEDRITPIGRATAAARLTSLAADPCRRAWAGLPAAEKTSLRLLLLENACRLIATLPAFELRFSLHGRFWEGVQAVLH